MWYFGSQRVLEGASNNQDLVILVITLLFSNNVREQEMNLFLWGFPLLNSPTSKLGKQNFFMSFLQNLCFQYIHFSKLISSFTKQMKQIIWRFLLSVINS